MKYGFASSMVIRSVESSTASMPLIWSAVPLIMSCRADDVAKVCLSHGRGSLRVSGAFYRVLEVGGRHLSVRRLEDNVVAEVEGVRLAVSADVPALGDVRRYLEVLVDGDEAAVDLDDVACGDGVGDEGRVEREGIAADEPQRRAGRAAAVAAAARPGYYRYYFLRRCNPSRPQRRLAPRATPR